MLRYFVGIFLLCYPALAQQPQSAAERLALRQARAKSIENAAAKGNYLLAATLAMMLRVEYRNQDRDFPAALAASKLALEYMQKSPNQETLDLAWDNLGRDQLSTGDAAAALESFQNARRLENGAVTKRAGWAWRDSIQAEIALKQIALARGEAAQFLSAAKNAPKEYLVSALLADADVAVEDGHFDIALDRIKEALAAGADVWDAVNLLASCNLIAMRSLNYDGALALARRIDSEFKDLPFSISSFAQATLQARRRLEGDIDGVLRDQTAALAAARDAKDVAGQIQALSSIAVSYRAANSISGQIEALKQVLTLERSLFDANGSARDPGRLAEFMRTLNNLGEAYLALAKPLPGAARKCFLEVMRAAETASGPDWESATRGPYAEAVIGKARVEALDDDAELARKMLTEALRGLPARADFNRPDLLLTLARLERGERRPVQAVPFYQQAIDGFHAEARSTNEATIRIELAHYLLTDPVATKDSSLAAIETAGKNLAAAEDLAGQMNLAELLWRTPYERGILAEAKGDAAGALQNYRAAISLLERHRTRLSQGEQQKTLLDREVVQDLYRRALSLTTGSRGKEEVWDLLERSKARVFLDSLGNKRFRVDSRTEPEAAQLNEMETRLAALRTEALPQNASALAAAGRTLDSRELAELETQLDFARQQESLGKTRAGNALAANPIALSRVATLLPPATSLIEFGVARNGIVAMVVSHNGTQVLFQEGSIEKLAQEVKFLQLTLSEGRSQGTARLMHSLSQSVLAPVMRHVEAGTKHLILVPAGFLLEVPFHAMDMPEGGVLIDRFTVSYLPSASVLEFLPQQVQAPRKVFVGALGNVRVGQMPPLEGTLQEAEAIAKLYPGSERATGQQFTYSRAREALMTDDLVHFATHGLFNPEAPMFSGIVTAPVDKEPSRLTVYDFADTLMTARTIVLSACETGLGSASGGDEVAGLTRSLLIAGANTVVSSLWKVSDTSTALLAREFHRRLIAGDPPALALRTASLEVRKQFPDPYYWAPFMVTGVI